ncbi:OmpA family protein [Pseudomonas sp. NPDC088444]|uniref:OmpA family protein n=1 Tax=Pseudomonas sp. NPDC088444 TaxID=3364456 RepID=UPI00384F414C
MTLKLTRMLYLWTAGLLLALCAILPLATMHRVLAILVVMALTTLAWLMAGRRAPPSPDCAETLARLKSAGRVPVVLVCGDGQTESPSPLGGEAERLRVTRSGVYLAIPDVLHLPETVTRLIAQYPDCRDRLRVMFVVNAVEHDDASALAGHVRTFCHQLAVARRSRAPLPLMLVSYQQTVVTDPVWFSWHAGGSDALVHDAGACLTAADWQRAEQQDDRLKACIQAHHAAHWLGERVLPHMSVRMAVCSIAAVPILPRSVEGNLWQQWLQGKIALAQAVPDVPGIALPLPDPLLPLLPRPVARTARRRAFTIALWAFTSAAAIALLSSDRQNMLLLRQVTDDVHRYTVITAAQRRDQPEFARQEQAIEALREDLSLLDNYWRHGEPLSLGFGLYRGEQLRAPLLAMIAGHHPPPHDPVVQLIVPIRLNSLSLFSSGSAQLRPDSTKVLINALQGIKAQPGWLIVISGHTDSIGSAEHNLLLSRSRAAAVRDWMQRMGDIPARCFAVQGFGDTQPIASNDNEAGRRANRRVDIRLVPEAEACMPSGSVADVSTPAA